MERNRDDAMNLTTAGVKKEKENAVPNIPNGDSEGLAQQVSVVLFCQYISLSHSD